MLVGAYRLINASTKLSNDITIVIVIAALFLFLSDMISS